jgi:hypothetical protein
MQMSTISAKNTTEETQVSSAVIFIEYFLQGKKLP